MENTMIDRLLPIFALIGFLSSIAYISLAAWLVYTKVLKQKKNSSALHHANCILTKYCSPRRLPE